MLNFTGFNFFLMPFRLALLGKLLFLSKTHYYSLFYSSLTLMCYR